MPRENLSNEYPPNPASFQPRVHRAAQPQPNETNETVITADDADPDYLSVTTNRFVKRSRIDFNAEVAESAEEGWTLRVLRHLRVSSFIDLRHRLRSHVFERSRGKRSRNNVEGSSRATKIFNPMKCSPRITDNADCFALQAA